MAQRKRYDSRFKAKVAEEALRNQRTIGEIASASGVPPTLVTQWKKRVLEELPHVFSNKQAAALRQGEALQAELYRQIGQLKVALDWLEEKAGVLG